MQYGKFLLRNFQTQISIQIQGMRSAIITHDKFYIFYCQLFDSDCFSPSISHYFNQEMHFISGSTESSQCLLLQGRIFTFAVFLTLPTANDTINLPWEIQIRLILVVPSPLVFPLRKKSLALITAKYCGNCWNFWNRDKWIANMDYLWQSMLHLLSRHNNE